MSVRVCYMERQDRGGALHGLRVVGPRSDEAWSAPTGVDPSEQTDVAQRGAEWVAEQLAEANARGLDRLCVDVDGAACSWVAAESSDPRVVAALLEQGASGGEDDPFAAEVGLGVGGRFPDLPGELGVVPLAEPASPEARRNGVFGIGATRPDSAERARFGVIAAPETPARLLLDALDAQKVEVDRVLSVWHAIAEVWDRSGGSSQKGAVDAEVSGESVTATVLLDPSGRLLWVWSSDGAVVAAGSGRLPLRLACRVGPEQGALSRAGGQENGHVASLTSSALARVSTEWLAWAAQLGRAPSRVTAVGPLSDASETGVGEVGRVLRRAAGEATVDLIDEADPLGLTLRRLSEQIDDGKARDAAVQAAADGRRGAVGLSARPGRAHRAMHRWAGLGLFAASFAMLGLAWAVHRSAERTREAEAAVKLETDELLAEIDPSLAGDLFPEETLAGMVAEAQERLGGGIETEFRPPKPILEELETISLVLGNPGYRVDLIQLTDLSGQVNLVVDELRDAEAFQLAIEEIAGGQLNWRQFTISQDGQRYRVQASGVWDLRVGGEG